MSSVELRGRFVWHELMTTDTAGAGNFYPRVAGWKSQPYEADPSYTLWVGASGPMGSLMRLPEGKSAVPSHWMPYIGTPDVAVAVEAARKLGAKVCRDTTEIPNIRKFAILADPQGATFAVYASSMPQSARAAASAAEGDFSWHELATSDPDAALRFYCELFGWGVGDKHDMGEMGYYQLFKHGGKQIGGIYALQPGVTTPHWLSYVRVSDVGKAASAAKAAGGLVINGPMEVPGGDWIAQIIDPQGAAFAVHQVKQAAKPAQEASKAARSASARRPAAKKRAAGKKSAAPRKRGSSKRAAASKTSLTAKRASAKRASAARRRRPAARKRVAARKGTARRRLRARKRR